MKSGVFDPFSALLLLIAETMSSLKLICFSYC
jgi:hypothetical protein